MLHPKIIFRRKKRNKKIFFKFLSILLSVVTFRLKNIVTLLVVELFFQKNSGFAIDLKNIKLLFLLPIEKNTSSHIDIVIEKKSWHIKQT